MAKKETIPTHTTIKTEEKVPANINNNFNNNNVNVNVHVPKAERTSRKKEKKPNWLIKAVVVAAIGLICSIILVYVKNSTAANGKPAYIQGGEAPITRDKK